MNEQILQSVLTEILEAQKGNDINTGLLTKAVENLSDKLTDIEKKASNLKIIIPPPNTQSIESILKLSTEKIENIVAAQPKSVTHEKRMIFFPIETHKFDFYKKNLNVILKWVSIVIIVLIGFSYIKNGYDNYVASDKKYKDAWNNFYDTQTKKNQKKMDSLLHSEKIE